MNYKSIINPKYGSLQGFIGNLPDKYDCEGMLIYDSRNTVKAFDVGGQKIIVKRFHRPMLHQRFDYTFIRPSKAKRAYTYALKLQEMHICTPEPIACIEEFRYGLFYRGYLITSFCGDPDARVLREELEGHDDLVNALAHFLVNMHEHGFMHGDTNLSNFLYRKDADSPTGYHITTIDINRSKFVEHPAPKRCIRNLVRLTHVRPALQKIVARYAELRGWDVEWAVTLVMQKLDAFEKRRELKHKMKGKKKIK